MKGATNFHATLVPFVIISIHAPMKGATYPETLNSLFYTAFQSTLP